jgi:hypothetical protein
MHAHILQPSLQGGGYEYSVLFDDGDTDPKVRRADIRGRSLKVPTPTLAADDVMGGITSDALVSPDAKRSASDDGADGSSKKRRQGGSGDGGCTAVTASANMEAQLPTPAASIGLAHAHTITSITPPAQPKKQTKQQAKARSPGKKTSVETVALAAAAAELCQVCGRGDGEDSMLLCGDGAGHGCDKGYHIYCLQPALPALPSGDWYCDDCECASAGAHSTVAAKKGAFRSSMSALVSKLAKLDEYGLFSRAVDKEEIPDYYEIIKQPMDLGKTVMRTLT